MSEHVPLTLYQMQRSLLAIVQSHLFLHSVIIGSSGWLEVLQCSQTLCAQALPHQMQRILDGSQGPQKLEGGNTADEEGGERSLEGWLQVS